MDDPKSNGEGRDDSDNGEARFFPEGFFDIGREYKHPDTETAENQAIADTQEAEIAAQPEATKIGIDRKIELALTAAITFFACVQLVTTCANNSSTSHQTDQLIEASRLGAYAADQNARAAGSFAGSAQGINRGIVEAVDRLNAQARSTGEVAQAAERQAITGGQQAAASLSLSNNANDSLDISQRAYVTLGRKDGTVADFIVPKNPEENAEVVLYFQNSGHLPAKFKWGMLLDRGLLGTGSKSTTSGLIITHPWSGPIIRTKNLKDGSRGEIGESSTIPGDSVFVTTMGVISQRDLEALSPNNMNMIFFGQYEFCDELGHDTTRAFTLRYRSHAPTSNLSFDLASEGPGMKFPPDTSRFSPGTVAIFPCETLQEERDEARSKR